MLDLAYLDRQTAGDAALQWELLGLFLSQIEDLERALDSVDPSPSPALSVTLHRVRGAALGLGAAALARALQMAEDAGPQADLAELTRVLRAAKHNLAAIIAAQDCGGLANLRESR